jgi:hypothetical protein
LDERVIPDLRFLLAGALIGVGATLITDIWAVLLKRMFNMPSLNFCLLGRWLLHMPSGVFMHESITAAVPKRGECAAGWTAHYVIGTGFALAFITLASRAWLTHPSLLPPLVFGIVTTLVPFFVMQPALGSGIAASRTANPGAARLKSLGTHTVFGLGLYLWALILSRFSLLA